MKSLRIKLLLWFICIITLSLAGLGAVNYKQRQTEVLSNLEKQRQAITKRAGLTLPDALFAFDDQQVENFLSAEMNNQAVEIVVVFDEDGKFWHARGRDPEGEMTTLRELPEGYVPEASLNLDYDQETLGRFEVVMSAKGVDDALKAEIVSTGQKVVVLTFVMIIAVWLLLQRIIIRPLMNLVSTMREMAATNDLSLRTRKVSSDEIGMVIESVNLFHDALTEKIGQLEKIADADLTVELRLV